MGWFEGLVGGFQQAQTRHREEQARRAQSAHELEQRVFTTLLQSEDPKMQHLAFSELLSAAGGPKRKGGLSGWIGEYEKSGALDRVNTLLKEPVWGTEQVKGLPAKRLPGATGPIEAQPQTLGPYGPGPWKEGYGHETDWQTPPAIQRDDEPPPPPPAPPAAKGTTWTKPDPNQPAGPRDSTDVTIGTAGNPAPFTVGQGGDIFTTLTTKIGDPAKAEPAPPPKLPSGYGSLLEYQGQPVTRPALVPRRLFPSAMDRARTEAEAGVAGDEIKLKALEDALRSRGVPEDQIRDRLLRTMQGTQVRYQSSGEWEVPQPDGTWKVVSAVRTTDGQLQDELTGQPIPSTAVPVVPGRPLRGDDPLLPRGVQEYVESLYTKHSGDRAAAWDELARAIPALRRDHPRLDTVRLARKFDELFGTVSESERYGTGLGGGGTTGTGATGATAGPPNRNTAPPQQGGPSGRYVDDVGMYTLDGSGNKVYTYRFDDEAR